MKYDYTIITPLFNERNGIGKFILQLEAVINELNKKVLILFINDSSTDDSVNQIEKYCYEKSFDFKILDLPYNVGQQNAIWIGVNYLQINSSDEFKSDIIVMDSDGEDDPETIKLLVKNVADYDVCFVQRKKRHESVLFKLGYSFYKIFFRILIGKPMNIGNYSIISSEFLPKILNQPFIHFASFLTKRAHKINYVQANRGKRIADESKIGFKGLFIHAFKSIIEFSDELIFFIIKSMIIISSFLLSLAIWVIINKYVYKQAILGWASIFGMLLFLMLIVLFISVVTLVVLSAIRNDLKLNHQNRFLIKRLIEKDKNKITILNLEIDN
jgi:glycosyltransferase involved in cell wall biosynthesis